MIGEDDTDCGACTGFEDSDELLGVLDGDEVEDAFESHDDFEFGDVIEKDFALLKK